MAPFLERLRGACRCALGALVTLALTFALASVVCSPLDDECSQEPATWWETFGEIKHLTHVDFAIEACEQSAVDACVDKAQPSDVATCEDEYLLPEFAACRVAACVDERTGPTDGISAADAALICVVAEMRER